MKGTGEQQQTLLEWSFLSYTEGTGKCSGLDTSDATNYKVCGCKTSLMCIDSSRTKVQKQSMAVLSGWIPLPKYTDNIYPCDSCKNKGLICVYRLGEEAQCVKSTLTNDIVLLGNYPSEVLKLYCKHLYLKADHLWMNETRLGGREGNWNCRNPPQLPDICNSVWNFTVVKRMSVSTDEFGECSFDFTHLILLVSPYDTAYSQWPLYKPP